MVKEIDNFIDKREMELLLKNKMFVNILTYLKNKKGNVVFSGSTKKNIKEKFIYNIYNFLCVKVITKKDAFGEYFEIPIHEYKNLKFYCVGGGREGDERKVQGMTVLYWCAYESDSYTKDFFNMMLTRLSMKESKYIIL